MLSYIVYEKQKNMRMMMKMHGLGDRPYWIITYAYFVILSICYILTFTTFGSLIGLKIFTLNEISVQLVFFFVYINLQIVFTIFLSVLFSDVKTATVIGYIYVIGSGILGPSFLEPYIEDEYYPRVLLEAMEIFPGFSLYHGLYELSRYSLQVEQFGTPRVCLKDIITEGLAMRSVLIIMIIEWVVLGFLAYYLDQIITNGKVGRHPLRFFPWSQGNQNGYKKNRGYDVLINMEKPDVAQEVKKCQNLIALAIFRIIFSPTCTKERLDFTFWQREIVQKMMQEQYKNQAVICDDMKKVYPGSDGNPDKHAVRGLSLTIAQKECFGLLGPNGAGKTSFIKMMTGLTYPTSGTAFIQGLDICKDMKKVHTFMGICPQHDLTWDILTGKEHLLFYGRLKNLKGDVLKKAVVDSLQAVNLLEKADVQVGEYSGGMKRRISVAISLIGNPKIVYMDEPSTGLDPASRKRLWSAVQSAKKDRAILLTTHSMEEADALCDRIGIFVDGYLQCIGSPSELKARYGGYLVLTVTTPSEQEEEVERLVQQISSKAIKVYHISGTQKFQLPKQGLKIGDIFRQVQSARTRLNIQAWGLSDITLEDVFIKVANEANSLTLHSLENNNNSYNDY
ncbi:ABC transporter A family member 8 [Apostasia shenzhenica]|uniref:ABC transporter A family member 8 n=1 Tax=Apostasia shenzhenica TaxID=1088818 RepID=A0A2H9ZU50_9ASPA|nr:ABC transporter A family member 8 [Apostasia shenzhenica]